MIIVILWEKVLLNISPMYCPFFKIPDNRTTCCWYTAELRPGGMGTGQMAGTGLRYSGDKSL